MSTSIPDIPFRSYDEFRLWERGVDSLKHMVELLDENRTNVALCEELMGMIEHTVTSGKDAITDLADEWAKGDDDKAKIIFDYQSDASTLLMQFVFISDQVAQMERQERA